MLYGSSVGQAAFSVFHQSVSLSVTVVNLSLCLQFDWFIPECLIPNKMWECPKLLQHTTMVALFPALPTVQFLAECKNGGGRPGPFYHMNDVSVYLGRRGGGGSRSKVLEFQMFAK